MQANIYKEGNKDLLRLTWRKNRTAKAAIKVIGGLLWTSSPSISSWLRSCVLYNYLKSSPAGDTVWFCVLISHYGWRQQQLKSSLQLITIFDFIDVLSSSRRGAQLAAALWTMARGTRTSLAFLKAPRICPCRSLSHASIKWWTFFASWRICPT